MNWAASESKPGINVIDGLSSNEIYRIKRMVEKVKHNDDIVIVSIHWGPNWGYEVFPQQRMFAHRLIDEAGVDLIHGHSSHHPKGIEVYQNKLILYGCGDFLNDYEGIGGLELFRGDLGLMYFASLDPKAGNLWSLKMVPTQIKYFKINNALKADTQWLSNILNKESEKLDCSIELSEDTLFLRWQ